MAPRRLSNYLWILGMKEEALEDIKNVETPRSEIDTPIADLGEHMGYETALSYDYAREPDYEDDTEYEEHYPDEPFWRYEAIAVIGWTPATDTSMGRDLGQDYVLAPEFEDRNEDKHQCFVFPKAPSGFPQLALPGQIQMYASVETTIAPGSVSGGKLSFLWSLTIGANISTSKVAYKQQARFCCHFRRLPRELWDLVYEYAMLDDFQAPIHLTDRVLLRLCDFRWKKTCITSLLALLPPLCHASRELLAEAGPVFLRAVIFIITDEESWDLLEKIMTSKDSARYIPNAVGNLREIWFQGLDPSNGIATTWEKNKICNGWDCDFEYCPCTGWKYHPQSETRAFLRQCTGLRKINLGILEWDITRMPAPIQKRYSKRLGHINDMRQLPNLNSVTFFCERASRSSNSSELDHLPTLSRIVNWLIEEIWTCRRRDTVEESWYHTHDLQRIYDPGEESFREYDRVWSPEKVVAGFSTRVEYMDKRRGEDWYSTEAHLRGLLQDMEVWNWRSITQSV